MRKIYLSAGHSNVEGQDRGAVSKNGSYIEGVLAVELRDLIKDNLVKRGVTVVTDDNRNALVKTLAYFKGLVSVTDMAIDIHFDAGGGTGCSTFIPSTSTKFEKDLSTDLATTISAAINVKNRGVKTELNSHHKTLGWMRLNCENILIETCFIDNTSDMQNYDYSKVVLAKRIADILEFYANH